MKTEIVLVVALCGSVLAVNSCRRHPVPDWPIPEIQAAEAVGQPPPSIEQAVRKKGEAIAAEAFGVLSSRLGKAMAEGGFTDAVQFCSVHGITFTKAVGVTNRVVLRRITHRPRNPENRADANELAIIRKFQTDLSNGVTPKAMVATNKPGFFTYYAPLTVQLPLCLGCHGDPNNDIHSNTLASIKQTYPKDEATGFKIGQLRGLWSVDFKRSDFAPVTEKAKP